MDETEVRRAAEHLPRITERDGTTFHGPLQTEKSGTTGE